MMNIEIAPEFRNEVTRRDPAGQDWLDQLPLIIDRLRRLWGLSQAGDPSYGKTSLVIPVESSHGDAALKLVSSVASVEDEARALSLFEGTAIVSLKDASIPERALLLERLSTESEIKQLNPEEAVTIAGEIAASLATVVAPEDIASLADNSDGWLVGIRLQHETALANDTHVPNEQVLAAEDAIRALGSDESINMTHGDLSLENIMRSTNGSWVAIDPWLTRGPVIHEAHTVARSLLPHILESPTPGSRLVDLTNRFCETAGIDYESAQRLSLARYVASYYWESQNRGDRANILRLTTAADLTYRLLQ